MLRITCPCCGERDEIEFRYRGDATRERPPEGSELAAFIAYVYERGNPLGWHVEWWQHAGGCRQLLKLVRHTRSHAIAAVLAPEEPVRLPPDGRT